MQPKPIEKVWIDPPKYWEATKNMTAEQRQDLMTTIEVLLSVGDAEQLRRFDFVMLENPYLRWRKAA